VNVSSGSSGALLMEKPCIFPFASVSGGTCAIEALVTRLFSLEHESSNKH
jgi:hypothetical protein